MDELGFSRSWNISSSQLAWVGIHGVGISVFFHHDNRLFSLERTGVVIQTLNSTYWTCLDASIYLKVWSFLDQTSLPYVRIRGKSSNGSAGDIRQTSRCKSGTAPIQTQLNKQKYSRRSWALWQETNACNRVARGDGIRLMQRERKELSHYTCTNIHEQPHGHAKHDQVSRRWQRPARCVTSPGVALRKDDAKEWIVLLLRKRYEKFQDKSQNMFWRGTLFMPERQN